MELFHAMKKIIFAAVMVFFIGNTAFGFAELLNYLRGHAESDAISLDWQSGNEANVKSYAIERSDVKAEDFKELSVISATGSNSTYHYRDANFSLQQSANHQTPLSDLYKYRLKINYTNAISYSQTITVTRPAAGVRRTWGMIKEMFH